MIAGAMASDFRAGSEGRLIPGRLFAFEQEFEFGDELVPDAMEPGQGVGCFGGAHAGIQGESVRHRRGDPGRTIRSGER